VAARRGKSQARRNNGNSGSLPGWAWMVLGIVLTVGVILAAPRFLKGDGEDGFFRPRANPDAQPMTSAGEQDDAVADPGDAPGEAGSPPTGDEAPQYDFYDLLPGEEVAMTDAQLAAAAREEAARAQREQQRQEQPAQEAGDTDPATASRPQPLPETGTPATAAAPAAAPGAAPTSAAAATAPAPASSGSDTPYILQAGAFGASGDAEAVKAKIALLGLNARVESAQIGGKTVYRVRMGPYGTASELAEAKGKLSSGGLPALAIKEK
jgi:cell division protein FtsN